MSGRVRTFVKSRKFICTGYFTPEGERTLQGSAVSGGAPLSSAPEKGPAGSRELEEISESGTMGGVK
jgi:hypothetical protein